MATDISKEPVDYALRWRNGFPRPTGPNQAVMSGAILEAFKALEPIARQVAALPIGTKKATYSGAGYLTGATVTEKDVWCAKRIIQWIEMGLPALSGLPIYDAGVLNGMRSDGQWLLMVATDLQTEMKLMDYAANAWSSIKDSVREFKDNVVKAVDRGAGILPWVLGGAAVVIVAVTLGRR